MRSRLFGGTFSSRASLMPGKPALRSVNTNSSAYAPQWLHESAFLDSPRSAPPRIDARFATYGHGPCRHLGSAPLGRHDRRSHHVGPHRGVIDPIDDPFFSSSARQSKFRVRSCHGSMRYPASFILLKWPRPVGPQTGYQRVSRTAFRPQEYFLDD